MTEPTENSEPPAAGDAAPRVKRLPDVPVFNCHVYISPPDVDGVLHARVSNLSEVVAQGRTQREVLQKIVAAFKTTVGQYMARGSEIPWTVPPLSRESNEQENWIAVHL